MVWPLRLEYPGAVYHLTAPGNARQKIDVDDEERRSFLQLLGAVVE
jgi:putative transposase